MFLIFTGTVAFVFSITGESVTESGLFGRGKTDEISSVLVSFCSDVSPTLFFRDGGQTCVIFFASLRTVDKTFRPRTRSSNSRHCRAKYRKTTKSRTHVFPGLGRRFYFFRTPDGGGGREEDRRGRAKPGKHVIKSRSR